MPPRKPIDRVREICLSLPEATEKLAWGEPTFRIRDKIFAQYEDNHHDSGIVGLWLNAPDGLQEFLVAQDPARFYRPKYVGHRGWVGVRMEGNVPWEHVADLIRESYRLTAPKRLAQTVESSQPTVQAPRARKR